jgi:acetylglutamate kinase
MTTTDKHYTDAADIAASDAAPSASEEEEAPMKYASERASSPSYDRAQTLIEALPWIKNQTGKTVLIKYGGAAMENISLMRSVMADIVLLKLIGLNPVIVHGGGKAISAMMKRFDLPVEFKNGLRVTTPESMELVRMVLMGQVNQDLVKALNAHGNLAVGLSGADAGTIKAECMDPELGRVGRITEVDPTYLEHLIADEYIPIIASIAASADDDGVYNINADAAAGDIAAAIHAHKIIYITDVDGLYEDFPNEDSLIARLTEDEARELIDSGKLAAGMIPKIQSCLKALEAGIPRAHIINGTMPHALLLELLTDEGVGTMIMKSSENDGYEPHALPDFASRLENNLTTGLAIED